MEALILAVIWPLMVLLEFMAGRWLLRHCWPEVKAWAAALRGRIARR